MTAVSTEMTVQMAVTMGIAGAQPNALRRMTNTYHYQLLHVDINRTHVLL